MTINGHAFAHLIFQFVPTWQLLERSLEDVSEGFYVPPVKLNPRNFRSCGRATEKRLDHLRETLRKLESRRLKLGLVNPRDVDETI